MLELRDIPFALRILLLILCRPSVGLLPDFIYQVPCVNVKITQIIACLLGRDGGQKYVLARFISCPECRNLLFLRVLQRCPESVNLCLLAGPLLLLGRCSLVWLRVTTGRSHRLSS